MSINMSRQELYERVWSEPIQKLSKEYGLSDVGLAKACRRYNIPIPPRGYWAKKQAGKRVSRPALPPEGRKEYGDQVRLSGPSPTRPVEPVEDPPPAHPLIAAEADPANAISVPEDLRVRHPLLRSTREYWRMVGRPNFGSGRPPCGGRPGLAGERSWRQPLSMQSSQTRRRGNGSHRGC